MVICDKCWENKKEFVEGITEAITPSGKRGHLCTEYAEEAKYKYLNGDR